MQTSIVPSMVCSDWLRAGWLAGSLEFYTNAYGSRAPFQFLLQYPPCDPFHQQCCCYFCCFCCFH